MRFPTPSDYVEALQFPEHAFTDPDLARGEVGENALGLPRVITGAYAAVFRVVSGEGAFAVRCFLTDAEDRRQRYRLTAEHLAHDRPMVLAPFDFQRKGVRVGEDLFPVVKMPWLDGEPLDAFVEKRLDAPPELLALREAWRAMAIDLSTARLAHGDLQHGNVLVAAGQQTTLRLVDYDAMWVPALAGKRSLEVGHRNYQHPDRTDHDFGPHVDRFPVLVVYAALTALAEAPELWERFSTGENLLFRSDDFLDPDSSPLFAILARIESTAPLAEALRRSCLMEPAQAPVLENVLRGDLPARPLVQGGRRRGRPAEQRPAPPGWILPVGAGGVVTASVLAVLGRPVVASAVFLVTLVVVTVKAVIGYRRLPAVRRRRRLTRETAVLRQWIADLEDQVDELDRERRAFLESTGRLRRERLRELQESALERRLKHHFVGELSDDEQVGHRAVIRLKSAGIRNAHHATAERVSAARELGAAPRAAIARWRAELVDRYSDEVPRELSAAEDRRLRRMVARRMEGIAAETTRMRAKAELQRRELSHVDDQLDALAEVRPLDYAVNVLRLRREVLVALLTSL